MSKFRNARGATSKSIWLSGFLAGAFVTVQAQAATETILYDFPSTFGSRGRLVQGSNGALYGTAEYLGGNGDVYRLRQRDGLWRFKDIFDFGGSNGERPAAGLTGPPFFGVTAYGGDRGYGTVFSLSLSHGAVEETVLHSFSGYDGETPFAELYKDETTGNLFGVALDGGNHGCGTFFKMARSHRTWSFSSLYSFAGTPDGCNPNSQLMAGPSAGSFIGTTFNGGSGYGTIFEMNESQGVWSASVVHTFAGGSDGGGPRDLIAGSDGSIYGVTGDEGDYGSGVAFQLKQSGNAWTYNVIYHFRGGSDGAFPSGIIFDGRANVLYGTTARGGSGDFGTVFELAYTGSSWIETVLHSFVRGRDGIVPDSRPLIDPTTGILYGTTDNGGVNDGGIIYSVQP